MNLLLKKITTTLATAALTLGVFFVFAVAYAQDDTPQPTPTDEEVVEETIAEETPTEESIAEPTGPAIPEGPSPNQKILLSETPTDEEQAALWTEDSLTTAGLKFMIRGKEALAWSLNIDETGFDNPAIQGSYDKVLTIVNSLFILGLLIIAGMWMFSLVIPRQALKRAMFYFVAAAVFVNFAFPLNRLFIDSTNLLQRTFLIQDGQKIEIADIVETPLYNDEDTLVRRSSATDIRQSRTDTINLRLGTEENPEVIAGEIRQPEGSINIIEGVITGEGGTDNVILEVPPQQQVLALNGEQTFPAAIEQNDSFSPNAENHYFSFALLALTGVAYLVLALIFVLRIVILWALMILSPILFLLAVFQFTRGYFYNWLSIYGRWLLIGPLAALGIAITVNIWKQVGLPITSLYSGNAFAELSNIGFVLPGSNSLNTLSTTGEMMEYVIFLLMLYVPIVFAFGLTRHKVLANVSTSITERVTQSEPRRASQTNRQVREEVTQERREKTSSQQGGLTDFVGGKIARFTETVLPERLKSSESTPSRSFEAASQFLPEHLAVSSIDDMMDATMQLTGIEPGSRHSKEDAIEKLANPTQGTTTFEQHKLESVRQEIEKRAQQGNAEAILVHDQIQSIAPQQAATEHTERTERVERTKSAEPVPTTTSVSPQISVEAETPAAEAPVHYETNIQEAPQPTSEKPEVQQTQQPQEEPEEELEKPEEESKKQNEASEEDNEPENKPKENE